MKCVFAFEERSQLLRWIQIRQIAQEKIGEKWNVFLHFYSALKNLEV